MDLSKAPRRKAIVVGAGPVGCLAAVSLAKQGWQIDIYEARPDIRLPSSKAAAQQRSINLAISSRGIAALKAIDPAAAGRILDSVIPMRGRMIHDVRGNTHSQPYDPNGQCINSIDRALLNESLLEEALAVPGLRIFFRHKIIAIDFDRRNMTVRDLETGEDSEVSFHLCIGADGTHSVVRRQLMRVVRMDYRQEYIPHDYLELKISPGKSDEGNPVFLLDPNHLHIWPRHSFMLIALPNKDMSFTCTLFAPVEEFERLDGRTATLTWFRTQFPDALALIGEEALWSSFEHNPRSSLMTVKARPYHYQDRAILLGDAAHSMVPFYGQGLNCGLEDVRVLDIYLKEAGVDPADVPDSSSAVDGRLAAALSRYSDIRHEDLVAICDLAMDNYVEMRHAVTTATYLLRKTVDNIFFSLSSRKQITLDTLGSLLSTTAFPAREPGGWIPLYTMVTFRPDISYATAKEKAVRQTRALAVAGIFGSVILGATGIGLTWMALCSRTRRLW
ncbi:FAD/NAD-P-binding domain-containing protein [Dentipellis sp. KUC8613]|nr:FAD/NAD-P-binding domain-containing protein [Dentipellis sp. KUC8613]